MKKNIKNIKLFLTDVDGVLTDSGMYYSENGDELKKFSTYDGMGFELLKKKGIKTGIITTENTAIVERRSKKIKADYLYQGIKNKLYIAEEICKKENLSLDNVAYIGDDINDYELLSKVGIAGCPKNALKKVKKIPHILKFKKNGGEGVVREFIDYILCNL